MTDHQSGSDAARFVHDGQADAMPCQCPACASPFVTTRGGYAEVQPRGQCEETPAERTERMLREARAC